MKKLVKKLSAVLLFAMIISLLPMGNVADAAKKYSYKKTLYEGEVHQLNYKVNSRVIKAKKVKWKSRNKRVATVSKKGLVKAKKKGIAIIAATYKKKTLLSKITVKKRKNQVVNPFPTTAPTPTPIPNNELAMNIATKVEKFSDNNILYTITNNNSIQISSVKLSVLYYDAMGLPVTSDNEYFDDVVAGGTLYYVPFLTSADLEKIDMTKTQVSVTVTNYPSTTKYVTENVKLEMTAGQEGKMFITYTNSTAQRVWVKGTMFYRDAAGAIVAVDNFIEEVQAGATSFEECYAPTYKETIEGVHEKYDKIPYTSVDWSYRAYYY